MTAESSTAIYCCRRVSSCADFIDWLWIWSILWSKLIRSVSVLKRNPNYCPFEICTEEKTEVWFGVKIRFAGISYSKRMPRRLPKRSTLTKRKHAGKVEFSWSWTTSKLPSIFVYFQDLSYSSIYRNWLEPENPDTKHFVFGKPPANTC